MSYGRLFPWLLFQNLQQTHRLKRTRPEELFCLFGGSLEPAANQYQWGIPQGFMIYSTLSEYVTNRYIKGTFQEELWSSSSVSPSSETEDWRVLIHPYTQIKGSSTETVAIFLCFLPFRLDCL